MEQYKGFYYELLPASTNGVYFPRWKLWDDPSGNGWLFIFDACRYGLTECVEQAKKQKEEHGE